MQHFKPHSLQPQLVMPALCENANLLPTQIPESQTHVANYFHIKSFSFSSWKMEPGDGAQKQTKARRNQRT